MLSIDLHALVLGRRIHLQNAATRGSLVKTPLHSGYFRHISTWHFDAPVVHAIIGHQAQPKRKIKQNSWKTHPENNPRKVGLTSPDSHNIRHERDQVQSLQIPSALNEPTPDGRDTLLRPGHPSRPSDFSTTLKAKDQGPDKMNRGRRSIN